MEPRNRRCVLLFARSPAVEARKKGIQQAARLFQHATQRIHSATRSLDGVDLVIVGRSCPNINALHLPQRGRGFGARLQNALHDVQVLGYQTIVAVGIDSPFLGASELRSAFSALEMGRPVLGPSADGGVYLIGYQTANAPLLSAIRWRSAQVLGDLLNVLPGAVLLRRLVDVDSVGDLFELAISGTEDRALRNLIFALIRKAPRFSRAGRVLSPQAASLVAHPIRGPPKSLRGL